MEGEINYIETSIMELQEFMNAGQEQISKIEQADELINHTHKIEILVNAINVKKKREANLFL